MPVRNLLQNENAKESSPKGLLFKKSESSPFRKRENPRVLIDSSRSMMQLLEQPDAIGRSPKLPGPCTPAIAC